MTTKSILETLFKQQPLRGRDIQCFREVGESYMAGLDNLLETIISSL